MSQPPTSSSPSARPPNGSIYATLDGWDPDGPSPRQRIELHAESQWQCGHGCVVGYDNATDKTYIFPLVCRRWDCEKCGPIKRYITAQKMQSGCPDKFITLTFKARPGFTPQDVLDLMKAAWPKLVKCIRREFGSFEYGLGWELHKSGSPHAHILARCGYIPQRWLSAQCDRLLGSPVVDIRKVKNPAHAARYVTKYILKNAAATSLFLGRRRLIQFSRHYLPPRDHSADADRFEGCEWHYTSARLNAVLSALPHSMDDRGFTQNRGGGVTVEPLPRQPHLSELVLTLGDTIMAFEVSQANAAPLPTPVPDAAPSEQLLPF